MNDTTIDTSHGRLAVRDSRTGGPAILFIHGNSSAKEVFVRQFEDPALSSFRLVAFDLPGHGASEDADEPARTYTFGGYAEAAEEICSKLGVVRPTIFGWSLGGHIALEMIGRGFDAKGVMISGAPPIAPSVESAMQGFNIDPAAENLTGKRNFTDDNVLAYATATSAVEGLADPHLLAMCRRTDGRARETMFNSAVTGGALDERVIVETTTVPLAIVNGEGDHFVNPSYFDTLSFSSLWRHGIVRLTEADHAPFLQQPAAFNPLLAEFATAGD